MFVHPKFQKCLSLLMAAVLLIGMAVPATASQMTNPEGGEQTTQKLFAKWASVDSFIDELDIPVSSSSPVRFFFGTSKEDCQEIPWGATLEVGGVANYERVESDAMFGDHFYRIGVTDAGPATITYTDEAGNAYVYSYTGTPAEDIVQGPVLYAQIANSSDFTEALTIGDNTADLIFYYGLYTNMEESYEVRESLSAEEGTILEYHEVGGYWVVGLEEGWNYGGIIYQVSDDVAVRFIVSRMTDGEDSDPSQGQDLYAQMGDSITDGLGFNEGPVTGLVFCYGVMPYLAPIEDPDALSTSEGVILVYDEENGSWSVDLEEGWNYGEIYYQISEDVTATFSVNRTTGDDTGPSQGPDLYAQMGDSITDGLGFNEGPVMGLIFCYGEMPYLVPVDDPDALSTSEGVILVYDEENGSWSVDLEEGWNYGEIYYQTSESEKATFSVSRVTDGEDSGGTMPPFYACNISNFNNLTEISMFAGEAVDVLFYFEDNNIAFDSENLSAEGVAVLERINTRDDTEITNIFRISVSGEGEGAIVYSHNDTQYRFTVTGKAAQYGLFATDREGNGYITDLTFPLYSCDLYLLFLGVPGEATQLTWEDYYNGKLGSYGVVEFFPYEGEGVDDLFFIGTSDTLGTGGVVAFEGDMGYGLSVKCEDASVGDILFAQYVNGCDTTSAVTLYDEEPVKLVLYYGDISNPQEAQVLDGSVVFTFENVVMEYDTEGAYWNVSLASDCDQGYVFYQPADGAEVTFAVKKYQGSDGGEPGYMSPGLYAKIVGTGDESIYGQLLGLDPYGTEVVFYYITEDSMAEVGEGELTSEELELEYIGEVEEYGESNVWKIVFPAGVYAGYIKHIETETLFDVRTTTTDDSFWADGIEGTIGGVPDGGEPVNAPGYVEIDYNGKTVSVGIGMFQEQTQTFVPAFGDEYNSTVTHCFGFQFILAALENHGMTSEHPADQAFLDRISDVKFYIPYWENEDGSTDASNCMLNVSAEPFAAGDRQTWRTVMVAENGAGFTCTLAMDFTYTVPGEEPVKYTVSTNGAYTKTEKMSVYATNPNGDPGAYLDTAEKLNAVLSSRENLEAWLEEYFPTEYQVYDKVENLTLYLPAVEYEDVIVMDLPGWPWVSIYGTHDDNWTPQTVMPGFVHKNGGMQVRHIYFKGDSNKKVTYQNSSFTCGVLMNGPADAYADLIGVGDCFFDGLDYGMYSTANGFTGGGSCNTFLNCTYGIYIDCKGKEDGAANDEFMGNQFINCKFAVWVKSLPKYITPYMLRIVDGTFLNNHTDIKVTTPGRHYYYFYRNYYAGTYQEVSPISDNTEGRAAIVDTEEQGAVVLTSPSRRYQHDYDNLWIYEDSTSILNSEADNLLIDQTALTDLEEKKEISIIDNAAEGTAVAVWTFGEEGGIAE